MKITITNDEGAGHFFAGMPVLIAEDGRTKGLRSGLKWVEVDRPVAKGDLWGWGRNPSAEIDGETVDLDRAIDELAYWADGIVS